MTCPLFSRKKKKGGEKDKNLCNRKRGRGDQGMKGRGGGYQPEKNQVRNI